MNDYNLDTDGIVDLTDLEFSGLLERYNITYERLASGDYKDLGTPFRKLSEREKEILQEKIDKIYNYFVDDVARNRNLSSDNIKIIKNEIAGFFITIVLS